MIYEYTVVVLRASKSHGLEGGIQCTILFMGGLFEAIQGLVESTGLLGVSISKFMRLLNPDLFLNKRLKEYGDYIGAFAFQAVFSN